MSALLQPKARHHGADGGSREAIGGSTGEEIEINDITQKEE